NGPCWPFSARAQAWTVGWLEGVGRGANHPVRRHLAVASRRFTATMRWLAVYFSSICLDKTPSRLARAGVGTSKREAGARCATAEPAAEVRIIASSHYDPRWIRAGTPSVLRLRIPLAPPTASSKISLIHFDVVRKATSRGYFRANLCTAEPA